MSTCLIQSLALYYSIRGRPVHSEICHVLGVCVCGKDSFVSADIKTIYYLLQHFVSKPNYRFICRHVIPVMYRCVFKICDDLFVHLPPTAHKHCKCRDKYHKFRQKALRHRLLLVHLYIKKRGGGKKKRQKSAQGESVIKCYFWFCDNF